MTGLRKFKTGNQVEKCGLARTTWPDNRGYDTALYRCIEMHGGFTIAETDVIKTNFGKGFMAAFIRAFMETAFPFGMRDPRSSSARGKAARE